MLAIFAKLFRFWKRDVTEFDESKGDMAWDFQKMEARTEILIP